MLPCLFAAPSTHFRFQNCAILPVSAQPSSRPTSTAPARRRVTATLSANMPPSRPAANPDAGPASRVHVGVLLASCTDAAARAVRVIRAVHADRENSDSAFRVAYKDVSDPRTALTIADTCAQAVIVNSLRRAFPGIPVVAEEDEEEEEGQLDRPSSSPYCSDETFLKPLHSSQLLGLETPEEFRDVALADICVCIDPVDATHQFVIAKRLDAVQTLVGISYKGRPIAAAIGLPFHPESPVISAMVGAGVVGLPPVPEAASARRARGNAILTGSIDPKDPVVVAAQNIVGASQIVPRGGAGNKILAVARGEADVAVLNRITSLWDTCATTALLAAVGGKVTDLCGRPIRHAVDARVGNIYGVVATAASFQFADQNSRSHDDLCRDFRAVGVANVVHEEDPVRLVASMPGEIQATDIARDLNGDPITADWLSSIVGARVESYSAPESSAVRYLMSDAVRLKLNGLSAEDSCPQTLFYKRVVLRELEHVQLKMQTAPAKILRDVTSYQVESSFLGSRACKRLCESGARIPKCYHVSSEPAAEEESLLDSRFGLLMEDYSPEKGWSQVGLLDREQLRAVLSALADMHAFFWSFGGDEDYAELCAAVWDRATYYTPDRQASDMVEKLPCEWKKHHANFADDLASAGVTGSGDVSLENLGERLASCSGAIADRVHGVGADVNHRHRTIIHGDSKAANFFFRAGASEREWDVGIIDFQWCGFGHPMVDVAYTVVSSADMSQLSRDGTSEKEHVNFYVDCLHKAFVRHGKARDMEAAAQLLTLKDALEAYDDSVLDLSKLIVGYHWARIKASPKVLEARANMLGSNSYNKSVPHAIWLVARMLCVVNRVSS